MAVYKGRCATFRPGIILAFIATLFNAVGAVFNASVIDIVGTGNLTALKYTVLAMLSVPFFIRNPSDITKPNYKELALALLSGTCMGVAGLAGYFSYNFIPIMDATTFFNAQPVIVLIISSIWLKEKMGIVDISTIFIVIIGIFCVFQPEFIFGATHSENAWIGYLSAGCKTIFTGFATCLIRRLSHYNPATTLVLQGIVTIPICFIWMAVAGGGSDPNSLQSWTFYVSGVTFSSIGRILVTISLKYEYSFIVSIVLTTEILFSLIFQIFVFNDIPNWIGILGACMVIIGVSLITVKEKINGLFQNLVKSKKTVSSTKSDDSESDKLLKK